MSKLAFPVAPAVLAAVLAGLLAPLLLAGCASKPAPTVDAPPPALASGCDADAAAGFIGKPASEANVQAAFKATGAKTLRSVKPGQPMTMDYRGDRANVMQDAGGNIERITCG